MMTTTELLLDVLIKLVESVADQPRRVLFKGVSDLSDAFQARVKEEGKSWDVRVTRAGEDVVGARNDATIPTLVVFYRDEVRERESLNAFRLFDEDAIAEALVRHVVEAATAVEPYTRDDVERLRNLLDLVYPSAERLATFLLAGKEKVGMALPHLGLFADPELSYDALRAQQWQARILENHRTAVLRWREFVEKGQRNQAARRLLGEERVQLLRRAKTDPGAKQEVLEQVTLSEALRVLNPPTRLVENLMRAGMLREDAEALVTDVKAGRVDPRELPDDTPPLPDELISTLMRLKPDQGDEADGTGSDFGTRCVGFCVEGLLRLARTQAPFPTHLCIARDDIESAERADLRLTSDGRWQVTLSPNAARALSVPSAGAGELLFRVFTPDKPGEALYHFSQENLAGRLEPYAEIWPDPDFWSRAATLDPEHQRLWHDLQEQVTHLRDVVDPDWKKEQEEEDVEPEREPNNPIYMIFDLIYLAHRDLFEAFLDAWLAVATLPWRAKVAARPADWREAMGVLLQLGLATRSDGSAAVLPFHPLRLAWHRAVLAQIERWLADATRAYEPLVFEPAVLSEQLQPVDRPRALIYQNRRLVEASSAPFFSLFVPEDRQQRARAPLDRARQKLEQFGRMWPFSLDRLHLAFQPDDASDDVYRLLAQQADIQRDAAFRVRAVVDNTSVMTAFDRYLLTTGDETTDLLTQEHHESLLPRVDYAKGRLDGGEGDQEPVVAHVALLVDAFREEHYDFATVIGQLDNQPHWASFRQLVSADTPAAREHLKQVDLSAPPYHTGSVEDGRRDLVYVPLSGDRPEHLRLLYDSLSAWVKSGFFTEGAYYERVRWDAEALEYLHHQADWVILFDRTLDKSLFERLAQKGIKLIDFYPNLKGGYRLSVSSRRTDAVEWQLVQVLHQFFGDNELDLRQVAGEMLGTLAEFASGLLLKTLGGGSLAQELLGLYATYHALIAEGEFVRGRDWLIPLDDYQSWFGRRTQRGRRADLLILRNPSPKRLEMLAVESKWYKQAIGVGFVEDEFGPDGQLRHTVKSLYSLFNPQQDRLDRDYWQKTLFALLEEAPEKWTSFRQAFQSDKWKLHVDGLVYVHQYTEHDAEMLAQRAKTLRSSVAALIKPEDKAYFSRGPNFDRLRLKDYPELITLLGRAGEQTAS